MAATAAERFCRWLEKMIDEGPGGRRLPSATELARTFGISAKTVNKLFKSYIAKGLVERTPGKGTHIAGESYQQPDTVPARSADALALALKESIARGEYRIGDMLPSVKYVCRTFGVSPSTVSKAYALLQNENLAVRVGRGYRVGTFRQAQQNRQSKQVYFYLAPEEQSCQPFTDDIFTVAYQKMERELSRTGHLLRFESMERFGEHLKDWQRSGIVPYGLVLYNLNASAVTETGTMLRQSYSTLKHRGQPMLRVLVDVRSGTQTVKVPGVSVLRRGSLSTNAARTVARWIVDRNCRNVMLFLRETPPRSGNSTEYFWNPIRGLKLSVELDGLSGSTALTPVFVARGAHDTTDTFLGRLFADFAPGHIESVLSKYRPHSPDELREKAVTCSVVTDILHRCRSADVWVFSNAGDAVQARNWCVEQRIDVPGNIKIIALENNPRFYHEGISCCEIDWENVGYLMAHALIGDIPIEKTRHGYIGCPAHIIERMTT
jgi:DNA-binding transcriptional regulator YhcF (GntR family)